MTTMIRHSSISGKEVLKRIRRGEISFAGNRRLKIYGMLNCPSGRKMKMENRVFFASEEQAIIHRYRPCKNCMNNGKNRVE